MQNTSHSRVKQLFNKLFNIKKWIDFERIRAGKNYVISQASTYFIPKEQKKSESFLAAKKRLQLTDEMLLERQQALLRLSFLMLAIAFGIFLYVLYELWNGYYIAMLISLVVMCIALVLAFRYHFWYFQIKNKQLGCSVYEWFKRVILGVKDE